MCSSPFNLVISLSDKVLAQTKALLKNRKLTTFYIAHQSYIMATVIAKNLTKIFDKKKVAVDSIDFEIEEGEVFGFLGPNGAGKSTTISMITGITKPTSGKLTVLGHEMPQGRRQVHELIGYVPQDLVFYQQLKVIENLKLFATAYEIKEKRKRIEYVMELMGLHEFQDQLSASLSGGQKRRLNVAMGLLHKPELLILDEPSAGMDPQSRAMLWKSVEKMASENMTIILTTHLMETADALSDRICIIDHGKIKAIDTPQELKQTTGKGDVIEIKFNEALDDGDYGKIKARLLTEFDPSSISNFDHTLTVTTLDGVNALGIILPSIEETVGRANVANISLRDNTLEDAFMAITGRQLREKKE